MPPAASKATARSAVSSDCVDGQRSASPPSTAAAPVSVAASGVRIATNTARRPQPQSDAGSSGWFAVATSGGRTADVAVAIATRPVVAFAGQRRGVHDRRRPSAQRSPVGSSAANSADAGDVAGARRAVERAARCMVVRSSSPRRRRSRDAAPATQRAADRSPSTRLAAGRSTRRVDRAVGVRSRPDRDARGSPLDRSAATGDPSRRRASPAVIDQSLRKVVGSYPRLQRRIRSPARPRRRSATQCHDAEVLGQKRDRIRPPSKGDQLPARHRRSRSTAMRSTVAVTAAARREAASRTRCSRSA